MYLLYISISYNPGFTVDTFTTPDGHFGLLWLLTKTSQDPTRMKFTDYSSNNYPHQERKLSSRPSSQMQPEPLREYVLSHSSSPTVKGSTQELKWSISNHDEWPSSDRSNKGNEKDSHDRHSLARICQKMGEKSKRLCCDLFLPVGWVIFYVHHLRSYSRIANFFMFFVQLFNATIHLGQIATYLAIHTP